MLYPEILNIRKSNFLIRVMLIISILVSGLLVLSNLIFASKFPWSILCIIGIVYLWVTTIYSIQRNVNIAGHVMIQMIIISLLTLAIDIVIGYSGWSVKIAIPIIIIVANFTMLVLTIVSRKKYLKYALYEIIIFIFSMLPLILTLIKIIPNNSILSIIAVSVSLIVSILILILCGNDINQEIQRRFHI